MVVFVPFGGPFPASTTTVTYPPPQAPTYTACLSTEAELWYLDLYQKASRREISLQTFWLSVIYPPYPEFLPLNVGLRGAFQFAASWGIDSSFVWQVYNFVIPPPLPFGRCAAPGEVVPVSFDTSFAELPEPPLPYGALPPAVTGAYAYTSEQCSLLAKRAFESDYGANGGIQVVLPHGHDVAMGAQYAVQAPTGDWADYRVVGKEWNFTGNVGTLTASLSRAAPNVELVADGSDDFTPPELYPNPCNLPLSVIREDVTDTGGGGGGFCWQASGVITGNLDDGDSIPEVTIPFTFGVYSDTTYPIAGASVNTNIGRGNVTLELYHNSTLLDTLFFGGLATSIGGSTVFYSAGYGILGLACP